MNGTSEAVRRTFYYRDWQTSHRWKKDFHERAKSKYVLWTEEKMNPFHWKMKTKHATGICGWYDNSLTVNGIISSICLLPVCASVIIKCIKSPIYFVQHCKIKLETYVNVFTLQTKGAFCCTVLFFLSLIAIQRLKPHFKIFIPTLSLVYTVLAVYCFVLMSCCTFVEIFW